MTARSGARASLTQTNLFVIARVVFARANAPIVLRSRVEHDAPTTRARVGATFATVRTGPVKPRAIVLTQKE